MTFLLLAPKGKRQVGSNWAMDGLGSPYLARMGESPVSVLVRVPLCAVCGRRHSLLAAAARGHAHCRRRTVEGAGGQQRKGRDHPAVQPRTPGITRGPQMRGSPLAVPSRARAEAALAAGGGAAG